MVVALQTSKASPAGRGASSLHAAGEKTVDFNRDVRPILAAKCWPCHGADEEALKKTRHMRLNTFAGATQDRGGYRAISPGKPDESFAYIRATSDVEQMRMPPPTSGIKSLTGTERQILRKWIEEGAEFRPHWAFVPPKAPALPAVSDPAWCRNPLDRFVLARLDREGLRPEPEADRSTLIRRASLTLTGLPPTPEEVARFAADREPGAYERLVDRLLASPRYGEHQARYWLDAVRYADTHGLHIDNERAVFPYRDWVIRALNEDLPFDQFTIWQIAGDLLPHPTTEQRIATGYVRMNPTTNEGGVIEAEFLAKNTFDRVETTATVFLGQTLTCARCHDHKYDPFSQKEYYGLYAFFNSTADPPLDGNLKLHAPVMKAPSPEQEGKLTELRRELSALEDRVNVAEASSWVNARLDEVPEFGEWQAAGPFQGSSFDDAFAKDFGPEPGGETGSPTWTTVEIKDGVPKAALIRKDNAATYLRVKFSLGAAKDFTVRVGSDDGIKIWLNGALAHENKALRALAPNQDEVRLACRKGENELLVKVVNAAGFDGFAISYGDALTERLKRAHSLASKGGLATDERRQIVSLYLEAGPESPAAGAYRKVLADFRALDDSIPMTYVAEELPRPRPARVLRRGDYDKPGEVVARGFPKALGGTPTDLPLNRLGLARWLVSRSNPLTARVTVNRIWQQHFGVGIVKTAEDFGSRGDWPSHPQLLDWLAVRFVKDGWSLKKLHRLIVTSSTFRQSASATKAKWNRDPENRLLARGPRFRLDAEVLRDAALFAGGLLVERLGGRGVKPYQPPGLWEIISYPISDTARYMQDHGDALYRRSVYLFWKRTSPPANMLIFDAPMREACTVRRSRTNTPTQALVTLNDPTFVEAARALAQRLLTVQGNDRSRIEAAMRIATARAPSADEIGLISSVLEANRKRFRADREAAGKLLSVGESPRSSTLDQAEHAAWTVVCNLLLNLDEFLTQH